MNTANIIIVVVSTLVLFVCCLLASKPKLQYWVRLIAAVLIVNCGTDVLEKDFNYSWVLSLLLMVFYLLIMFSIAKAIDNYYKSVNKKN